MRLAIPLALLLASTTAPRQGCGNGSTPPAYDPCAEKACGASCTVCPPGATDCVETAVVKACDLMHRCVPAFDGMCAGQDACAGKACGTPCDWPDLPCLHADPPCLPPVGPGYCDASGACAQGYPPPPSACPPLPPSWGCVGKACGDGCGYCPPDMDPANCPVPTFAPTVCDARLQCVSAVAVTCSPEAACHGKTCGAACETCPACMRPAAMYCDASGACAFGLPTCPP